MRFKWLPVNSFEDATGDLEQAQIHGIFDDTPLGGDLSGKLPNPSLATGTVLRLAATGTTRKIAFGSSSVTFTASTSSNVATIAHGLGAVPVFVGITPVGVATYISQSALPNSTNIFVQLGLASAASVTVSFQWTAIG